jgi:hypothetical protein
MAYMRGMGLAAALLMLAACGGSTGATPTPSSATSTPTPVASAPFPSPTPGGPPPPNAATVTCGSQIPAGAELALVTLRNTVGVIVRDITDLAHPVTRCTIKGAGDPFFRFIDATHISYITNGGRALYMVDLLTRTTSLVRAWGNQGSAYWVYAWSPDGRALSYLSSNGDQVEWHLLSAAGDVTLSKLGSFPGRGANPDSDDAMVGFSADGQYVALEQTISYNGVEAPAGQAAPFQVVRLSDHKVVYSRMNGTMATWAGSGAAFYFRTAAGVEEWDPANGPRLAVANLQWIHPWPSANGQLIVYATANAKGNHLPGFLRLPDNSGGTFSNQFRTGEKLLKPLLLWYAEEAAACVQCDTAEPRLTGRTYIRDLNTGTDEPSIITAVFDSWPHVSAS